MTERIIIAGAGGQGIMLMGKVMAQACLREDKQVTWLPAYGAEVRGGTAHCMLTISDQEIGSPYITIADTLIIMNEPSWEKFRLRRAKKGIAILNSSFITGHPGRTEGISAYPFSDIALKLGNIKVANMAALGCYIGLKKTISLGSVLKVIAQIAPAHKKDLIEINQKAAKEGFALVR